MNKKSMKARFFGLLRRTRTPVLVVMAALVLVATPVAFAANGKPFVLGKTNVETAVSKLVMRGAGPALELRVRGGQPPLRVNSAARVANLNADRLDGLHRSAFLRSGGKAADSNELDGKDSTAFLGADQKAADSDTLDGQDSSRFVKSEIYGRGTSGPGIALSDGTHAMALSCAPGDLLLSGGPNGLNAGSCLLDSFPGDPSTWSVRIHKNGQADDFSVAVICANQ